MEKVDDASVDLEMLCLPVVCPFGDSRPSWPKVVVVEIKIDIIKSRIPVAVGMLEGLYSCPLCRLIRKFYWIRLARAEI